MSENKQVCIGEHTSDVLLSIQKYIMLPLRDQPTPPEFIKFQIEYLRKTINAYLDVQSDALLKYNNKNDERCKVAAETYLY